MLPDLHLWFLSARSQLSSFHREATKCGHITPFLSNHFPCQCIVYSTRDLVGIFSSLTQIWLSRNIVSFLVHRAVQCIELMNDWLRLTIFLWLSLNFTREFLDYRRIRSLFNVPTVGGLSDCNFNTYWAVRWHGPQLIPWERGVPVPWAQRPVGHWVALP